MNKRGITLIALVVTIIILLILAAISIALLLGPDGIINKARESKTASRYSEVSDLVDLRNNTLILNFKIGEPVESEDDFVNRLKAQKLILEGEYDSGTRTITIGGKKKTLLSSDKDIIDAIANLPDADAPGKEHLKHMTLKVRTTMANESVEIPISDMTNLTIDWGDGNTTSTKTHTYNEAKDYEIKIIGKSNNTGFGIKNSFSYTNPNLVGIMHWGENDFIYINSFGQNLEGEIPVPSRNSFVKVTDFNFAFLNSSKPISIPEHLFANSPNVTSFFGTFSDCSGLTQIPTGLFDNNLNVTDFYGTFDNCSGLTQIPTGLFDNNPNVTDFSGTFYNCSGLTQIPTGLFDNNPNVTTFDSTFYGCSGLTGSIPPGLFDNNPNVTTFDSTFYGCSGLTGSIPPGLFDNNPNVTDFYFTFSYCSGLTGSIPTGLFDNNPNVTTFYSTFYGCSGLTGSIPTGLFDNNLNVTDFASTFYNCSGLTGSIPTGLFDNNPNVTTFYNTFSNCSGLTGPAPELWTRTNVTSFSYCFRGCTNLSNYADIPAHWK